MGKKTEYFSLLIQNTHTKDLKEDIYFRVLNIHVCITQSKRNERTRVGGKFAMIFKYEKNWILFDGGTQFTVTSL